MPRKLWIPPRNRVLGECWVAAAGVVSIYAAGTAVYVGLAQCTLVLYYASAAEAERARDLFVRATWDAEPDAEARAAYPEPTDGKIQF